MNSLIFISFQEFVKMITMSEINKMKDNPRYSTKKSGLLQLSDFMFARVLADETSSFSNATLYLARERHSLVPVVIKASLIVSFLVNLFIFSRVNRNLLKTWLKFGHSMRLE